MASMPRRAQMRMFTGLLACAVIGRTAISWSHAAFAIGARILAPPQAGDRSLRTAPQGASAPSPRGGLGVSAAGLASGAVASVAALAAATRRSRVAARVTGNSPSLLQVLEQKKLLSTVGDLKLLSKAEAAGVGIQTVEELGLLKFAEDNKLLSLAENIVTASSTPVALLAGSVLLAGATYLDVTAEPFGFLQWVIAGVLGVPALLAFGAAVAIFGLTSGTRRTKPLDRSDRIYSYGVGSGFKITDVQESVSLLDALEKKKLLSFVEDNRLLTLASGFVDKPLTLTEGLLPTVEKSGLLSTLESTAADPNGFAKIAISGLLLLILAAVATVTLPEVGGLIGVLAGLAGITIIIACAVLTSLLSVPRKFTR